jgi:predicted nucleotidyltransferase
MNGMIAEQILSEKRQKIETLCVKYAVRRLRLFGSALREDWNPESNDFDFLAEFDPPIGMNAFDQLMGFILDMESLFGPKGRCG